MIIVVGINGGATFATVATVYDNSELTPEEAKDFGVAIQVLTRVTSQVMKRRQSHAIEIPAPEQVNRLLGINGTREGDNNASS